jgi:hypothetical protein
MYKFKLLTRDNFRESVFERDNHTCVFCDRPAVDAHHILERRLFDDGGYYLENGASVCGQHHLACEMTLISVEAVREACGITRAVIPEHFYSEVPTDKWGNPFLGNGQRIKGELFFDESVQKILKMGGVLSEFAHRVKYQRTYHVPWSPGFHGDDRRHRDMSFFHGKRVIVTKKMDGENSSLYWDYFHARSVDSPHHHSRDWVKNFWSKIKADIPVGWRICGENLYAEHSIRYEGLPSYFLGFSIFDEKNVALSWDETIEWFDLLGITPVEKIYDGIYDEAAIKALFDPEKDWETMEGYVIRVADSFTYAEFRRAVGKFVRKNHVTTQKHWKWGSRIKPNGMARKSKKAS